MSKELLEHAEGVLNDFCDDLLDPEVFKVNLDPYTTEEKIVMASEQQGLSPYEISELVQKTLDKLPDLANPGDKGVAFDILYEAISEGINKR